jgi:DNA primase
VVSIEEVAQRNNLELIPNRHRPGQYTAHCPSCGDVGRRRNLEINAQGIFHCWACGAKGGVVAFHAWLSGLSFRDAKQDLYPQSQEKKRFRHPADDLTHEELKEMGFVSRKLSWKAPSAISQDEWNKYVKRTKDYIYQEWLRHCASKHEQEKRIAALLEQGMATQNISVVEAHVMTA